MARLPDVDQLGGRPIPRSQRSISSVRNAGAVADAVGGLGEQVGNVGQERLRQDDQFQLATARSQFLSKKIDLDAEFSTDRDFDTQEKRYNEKLSSFEGEVAKGIKSNTARRAFEIDVMPDKARAIAGVKSQIVAGQKDQNRATLFNTLDGNNRSALSSPDPQDSMRLIEASTLALEAAVAKGDISAVEAAEKRVEVTEGYAKGRLSLFPDTKQVELLQASMKAEKTGSFIDFLPLDKRKDLLDSAKIRVRTEERAARAEQRLALQADIDEAQETLRLVNDGVPLPQEKLRSAQEVAKLAGKGALSYGLGVAMVKNRLSTEFKSAVPSEIQAQISGLDVKISKAGEAAKPEDVIARDHLVSLRDKAKTELNNDPLSWGAAALGMPVSPLDWDDPAALGQRLKSARTISKRAGVPLSPFTDEEKAELVTQMETGPAGQLSVLDKLRRLGGSGAVAAARQLAPDNEGFRIAAGLATLPNAGIARSTSRDAVIGADALKAQPDIFKQDVAQKQFGDIAAESMKLLPPEMRKGVYDAAKNIYAARLSRDGKNRWEPDGWPGAISSALGAYRDGQGVQRGGLGKWRGEAVILPYGWSQQEFDGALSRIDETAVTKAANGVPVWANGKPVPLRSLRGMKVVNDGEGTYRLSDGNGYISRAGGGPFRIDIRKLKR